MVLLCPSTMLLGLILLLQIPVFMSKIAQIRYLEEYCMSEETTTVWREALTNRDHELYPAAWTVFMDNMNVDVAAERLSEQKETVLPFLYELINDEDLYMPRKLGEGRAPVNAVRLLGAWKVQESLPELLEILAETVRTQPIYRAAINAIAELGADVIDDVLAWVEEEPESCTEAAEVLGRVGKGDQRAFDAIQSWIVPDDYEITTYANHLIRLDAEQAAGALRKLSQNREFSKEERNTLRNLARQARQTARQEAEQAETASSEETDEVPQEVTDVSVETEEVTEAQPADTPLEDDEQ